MGGLSAGIGTGLSIGNDLTVGDGDGLSIGGGLSFPGNFPPVGENGILLENGTDFLMLEGAIFYLLQEA